MMKLSKLEKRFLAFLLTLALIISFVPPMGRAEAKDLGDVAEEIGAGPQNSSAAGTTDNSAKPTAFPTGEEEKQDGYFYYKLDKDGNVVITDYSGSDETVEVPSTIDGKTVVSVYAAFRFNDIVKEIVLPNTVTKLEYGAFQNAVNLEKVNLENIKYFGSGWGGANGGTNFESCTSLDKMVLPEGLIVNGQQFINAKMNSLTIPAKIYSPSPKEAVYFGPFETGKLNFAEGITKIAINFSYITVPEIVIPDTVTDISQAKLNNTNADKIVIGKGIKKVHSQQFAWMEDIDLQLGSNTEVIEDQGFYYAQLTSLVIPDSVTEIQYQAFKYTSALTDLTFSKNLKKIVGGYEGCMYESAWYDDQSDGVVYTGGALYAYKGSVPKNTKISVKSGTKGIGYMALQTEDASSANITEVTLPDGLQYIGGVSLFNTGIKDIKIPNTVTEIGAGAFGNTNLKSVSIPKSVKTIGDYAFGYECADLKSKESVWVYDPMVSENMNYWYVDFFGKNENLTNEDLLIHEPSKVSGFTIYGYKGTAGESYAKANGFKFVDLEGCELNGHSWGAPVWTWNGVSSATATFTCTRDSSHRQTVSSTITKKVTKQPSVKGPGLETYTATATFNGKTYTNIKTNPIKYTGWKKIGKSWYLFNSNGYALTGWQKSGGKWYYLTPGTGVMVTGWKQVGKSWYYFKASGVMAAKEYVKGYWLNANGTWTYKPKASWKKNKTGWYYIDTKGWYAKSCTLTIDGKKYKFNSKGYCTNP